MTSEQMESSGRNPERDRQSRNTPLQAWQESQKQIFLAELAATSCVAHSARKAKLSRSTLYLWRDKDNGFAEEWRAALASGFELLEMELLVRARRGVDVPVFHGGKHVGTIKQYNDATALRLLALHKETVAMTRATETQQSESAVEVRARIDAKLNAMRERLQRRRARENDANKPGNEPLSGNAG
ncbi:hypothetical protein [Parasphingorhabdus sp.]|uniref:hypothetical protein n=1 Tax=Parasphingorhabdus sp. TaxID=2709688 RepID=UPI003263BF37